MKVGRRTAVVIGGTGPTGLFIVNGLRARGYRVAILHRGTHENPEMPPDVEHIHCDPHFAETLIEGLGDRAFDVAIATYGRTRVVAEVFAGRAGKFIAASGQPAYRGYFQPAHNFPEGLPVPTSERAARVATEAEHRFSNLIASSEDAVLAAHPSGTVFRYPYVFGPHQPLPREVGIVRRILDGRQYIILPEGGTALLSHGAAENVAHAVLLAVDKPRASAGKSYNCADDRQFTLRQTVEIISDELGHRLQIVSLPDSQAFSARSITLKMPAYHIFMDTHAIRTDLGYRDIVDPEVALRATARWYATNPAALVAGLEKVADPLDYVREDRVIEIFKRTMADISALDPGQSDFVHVYAHPRTAGRAVDHRGR